ncbi:hypothetical protein Ahia01_000225400, partial [Argonauta hians]
LTKTTESSYEATGGVTSTTTQERRTVSEDKKVSSTKE